MFRVILKCSKNKWHYYDRQLRATKKGSEPRAQAIKLSQKPNIIHIRLKGVI